MSGDADLRSEEKAEPTGFGRRTFLKWSGAVGGSAALVGTATHLGMPVRAEDTVPTDTEIVWSACTVNCGSRCPLRLEVKEGTVIRVLADNTGSDELGDQQVRACVRGRSMRHRIYNPDRLKKPMKRKEGTRRGDEQWEEISWEQALDEIAEKMKAIKSQYGNEAFYINYGTGTLGSTMAKSWPPDQQPFARLMNTWGGYLDHYADYSTTNITSAYPYFYGTWYSGNSFDDAKNARLQVMFGNNPLETRMSGGGQTFITQQTKRDSGVRTIVFDPRYSETAALLSDDWIPLFPGTDAALIAGMIHVMLSEGLQDQDFLDTYCVGFDEDTLPEGAPAHSSYRSYVEGAGPDGTEKTPEWAAEITGVPAQQIRQLAREIATAKPCAITQGWGPQRHANGEHNARAIFLLACVTGNVGVPGGGIGAREGAPGLPIAHPFNSGVVNPSMKMISVFNWFDAIKHGADLNSFNGGVVEKVAPGVRWGKVPVDDAGNPVLISLETPLKMLWQYGGNSIVNQTGDNNRSVELLQDESGLELIVTCDIQYTVSARYSDYVLPGTSTAEEFDFHDGENAGPMAYGIVSSQAIEPLFECRNIYDICTDLAKRLGTEAAFTEGKSREEWLRATIDASRENDPSLPDYDDWKQMGIYRTNAGPVVALAEFRDDPKANPLPTPSGKIEIYSHRLHQMSKKWEFGTIHPELPGDRLVPLPEYVETWEGVEEARTSADYPLQVIGHHFKGRTHSSYGNVDWLQEAHPQTAWISVIDAEARGISNGDQVFVYNERGTIRLPARATERIMPGVVSVPQGAWYDPKDASEVAPPPGANPDKPVDVNGSVNTLTSLHPTAQAKGMPSHTTLAQVVKS
ncbi:MAG: DMSO/selenate family reductase complex A subunit [Propioniciclava sp.]